MLDEQARLGGGIGWQFPDVAVAFCGVVRETIQQGLIIQPLNLVIDAAFLRKHRFGAGCKVKQRHVPMRGQGPPTFFLYAILVPSGDTDGHSTLSWMAVSVLASILPLDQPDPP